MSPSTAFEPGPLAPDTIEALTAGELLARELKLASGSIRPCIATVYHNGADSERQPYAHVIGVELFTLGVPLESVETALRRYNNQCSRPLPVSEITKVIRGLERRRVWAYSCKHRLLAPYCIGAECPYRKNAGTWKGSRVSANGLTVSGWLPLLSGAEVKVFLGLYRLAKLKGRGPEQSIPFTFRELECECGVGRGHLRETLELLRHRGLIAELHFSDTKGEPSTFRFPTALPEVGSHITGVSIVVPSGNIMGSLREHNSEEHPEVRGEEIRKNVEVKQA